jgi:UDP-3-O-acyl-N-acetylglucosamine deacetylase
MECQHVSAVTHLKNHLHAMPIVNVPKISTAGLELPVLVSSEVKFLNVPQDATMAAMIKPTVCLSQVKENVSAHFQVSILTVKKTLAHKTVKMERSV